MQLQEELKQQKREAEKLNALTSEGITGATTYVYLMFKRLPR